MQDHAPRRAAEPVDVQQRARLTSFVLLAGVYAVFAALPLHFAGDTAGVGGIWAANAIAVSVMVRQAASAWRFSTVAIIAGSVIANAWVGRGLLAGGGLTVGSVLQIILAAFLVRRWFGERCQPDMGLAEHLRVQFVASVATPIVGGFFAARATTASMGGDLLMVWWTWWSGTVLTMVTVSPSVLTASWGNLRQAVRGRVGFETLGLAILSIVVMGFSVAFVRYPFVLFSLPLAAAALRTTPFATALISFLSVSDVLLLNVFGVLAPLDRIESPVDGIVPLFVALAMLMPFSISVLVAQQRRERSRIAESEERFRTAMDNAAIGMALVGLDGTFLRVNRSLSDMLGYALGELQTKTFQEITHPEDLAADLDLLNKTLAGEIDSYRIEKRYFRKDGSVVWALLAVSIVRDAGTRAPLYFISQIENITARKNAEEALALAESRWNFALESARQGVWDYNVAAGRSFYSPLWKAMIGYGPGDLSDEPEMWRTLIHPDDRSRVEQLDQKHLDGGSPYFECEFRMRHRDGHWVWILDRGKVIERDAEGKPLRMVGTHTDITSLKESEARIAKLSQRIQLAAQAGGVGLWEFNYATGELWWDARMCELYGLAPQSGVETFAAWKSCIHPDDRARVESEGRDAAAGLKSYDTEFRIVMPDGRVRHVRALADRIAPGIDSGGLLIGTNWDITEHRQLTDALVDEKERLRTTLQSLGDAVISTDTQQRITLMNTAAEDLTGWPADEAIGQPLSTVIKIVDESTGTFAQNPVEECLTGGRRTVSDRAVLVSRKGRRDIHTTAAPVHAVAGEVVGAVLVLQDVTEARRLQRELTHSATHDALTGLTNRTAFEASLRDVCAAVGDSGARHALCFVDLDRFKIVNDTAGHAAGDALLREIGQVIRQNVRSHDVTARLGGDEFGLILLDCDLDQAELVAKKLVDSIQAIPFAWDGRAYDVGASAGLTVISEGSAVPSELLSQADIACYTAKSLGRNRVAVYRSGESDARRLHRDLQIAARIRGAIENDRFRLFAQEIRPLREDRVQNGRHFEVLLRMLDEDGTLLEPQAFIPAAERYDLMAKIDRWVFRNVLRRFGDDSGGGAAFTLSVNLSANSLSDPGFWPFLENELLASRLSAGRLRLEITETALINNLAASSLLVESAQRAGCAIMLDDFGTGLSSFAYLKRFPIQFLKIDGSFTKNLVNNPVDRAIVESINDIAHKLGAETIAEWVETEETTELLRSIGVDFAQGYAVADLVDIDTVLSRADSARRRSGFAA